MHREYGYIMSGDGYIDDVCLVADSNMNISNMSIIESKNVYEQ
jgi:hypothetical protein